MEEPLKKKPKCEDNHLDAKEIDRNLIRKMMESRNNLQPILIDDLLKEAPKSSMYKAVIKDRKLICRVISELAEVLPLGDFQHLKRAKGTNVLLCSSDNITIDQLKNNLKEKNFDYELLLEENFDVVEVTSKPPLVKWQFDLSQKLWPCNFHPNKYTENLTSGSFFNENDLAKHRKYMAVAFEIGLLSTKFINYQSTIKDVQVQNDNSILLKIITQHLKENGNQPSNHCVDVDNDFALENIKGTVIVDPQIDSIVAIGYDRRHINPCQHHIMIAIDNVAKSQYGGAWNSETNDSPVEDNDGRVYRGVPGNFMNDLKNKFPTLKFGARPTKRRSDMNNEDDVEENVSGPYLCTDYDVYTTNEPCIMCAMALVHSRAKKVFFGLSNPKKGALVSKCKLHTVTALNHRYEVFSGFFE